MDALSDGIFGVPMTPLIIHIRLPDDFHPRDAADLAQVHLGRWPKWRGLANAMPARSGPRPAPPALRHNRPIEPD